jgi:hypothetical protein
MRLSALLLVLANRQGYGNLHAKPEGREEDRRRRLRRLETTRLDVETCPREESEPEAKHRKS